MMSCAAIDGPDDHELLMGWHAGDLAATSELFDRYFELLATDLGDVPDAEDLVMEAFVRLSHGASRSDPPASVLELLRTVEREVQAVHLRRRYPSSTRLAVELAPTRYADRGQRLLLLTLDRVPVPERRILELHVWEQLSVPDLAVVLDMDVDTTCERLRDAITAWQRVAGSPRGRRESRSSCRS